jgi:hypothetical protein
MTPPQSNREKQQDFRARMALLGMREVRGVYLPPELHGALKEKASEMLRQFAFARDNGVAVGPGTQ